MGPLKKSTSKTNMSTCPHAGGPGGPIEIVFTFDTTGSMSSCLVEVRKKLDATIQRLFSDIPNLRIAVFAHGDYGDVYVTKYVDFTNDVKKLCDFVNTVQSTGGGGDWEECYELVLKQTRELLSWSAGTQRSVVMIGDAVPHSVGDRRNQDKIDWEDEAEKIRDEVGAHIYAVQAYDCTRAKFFWEGLAKLTFGKHLKLGEFDTIVDMMMAICYKEHGAELFENYEREVRIREGKTIRKELDQMFDSLRDGTPAGSGTGSLFGSSSTGSVFGTSMAKASTPNKFKATKRVTAVKQGRVTKRIKNVTVARKKSKVQRRILKRTMSCKAVSSQPDDNMLYSIGRQYRETVSPKDFSFNHLDWTSWQLAISSHPEDVGKLWTPRPTRGYSVKNFKSKVMRDAETQALYEFAVQPEDSTKMYPVCLRAQLGGSSRQRSWETRAIRSRRFRESITSVTKSGGKIFMRKAPLERPVCVDNDGKKVDNVMELRKLIRDTYDYAWNHTSRSFKRKGLNM